MRNITFELSRLHEHGSAFFQYLKLRKRYFVDELGWEVPHNADYEMDQYDNPEAFYSLVLRGDTVVAGTRVMPTSARFGKNGYMLGDARKGKLATIPISAMPADIATPQVWEVTRLVVSDELTTAAERSKCLSLMGDGLFEIAEAQGCSEYICLSKVSLVRVLRHLGYPLDRMGDPYFDPRDGRRYAVLRMPVHQPGQQLMAAE